MTPSSTIFFIFFKSVSFFVCTRTNINTHMRTLVTQHTLLSMVSQHSSDGGGYMLKTCHYVRTLKIPSSQKFFFLCLSREWTCIFINSGILLRQKEAFNVVLVLFFFLQNTILTHSGDFFICALIHVWRGYDTIKTQNIVSF